MVSLRASGMSIDDKEKIEALKYYISKAGNAKLRSLSLKNESSLEYVALRNENVIPHTVFLAPNDRSLDVCTFRIFKTFFNSNCKVTRLRYPLLVLPWILKDLVQEFTLLSNHPPKDFLRIPILVLEMKKLLGREYQVCHLHLQRVE